VPGPAGHPLKLFLFPIPYSLFPAPCSLPLPKRHHLPQKGNIDERGTPPIASLTLYAPTSMLEVRLLVITFRRLLTVSSNPPPGPGYTVGQRLDDAIELIEMEVRHAAAYVNSAVIPQVRAESICALRNVADTLRKFADRLDRQPRPEPPPTQSKEPRP